MAILLLKPNISIYNHIQSCTLYDRLSVTEVRSPVGMIVPVIFFLCLFPGTLRMWEYAKPPQSIEIYSILVTKGRVWGYQCLNIHKLVSETLKYLFSGSGYVLLASATLQSH